VRGRGVRLGAIAAAVVVLGAVAFLATRGVQQGATPVDSALIGTASPRVATTTLAGAPFDLAALRGRVVVLSFFASWCPPCKNEAPELATFAYDEHARGAAAVLYGVVYEDSNAAAALFVRTYGGGYQVLRDPNGTIASSFGVTGPPVTVVVGPTGRIDTILEGAVTAHQLEGVVASAGATAT